MLPSNEFYSSGFFAKSLFLCVVVLFGCNNESVETNTEEPQVKTAETFELPMNVEAKSQFMPSIIKLKLPEGFKLDSTVANDKAHNTKIRLHYPVSGNADLDRIVGKAIAKGKKDYIDYIEKWAKKDPELLNYQGNYYHYKLLSISESKDIISYLFLEQGFVNGMMTHSQYVYLPINYNRKTKELLTFEDVLSIKTPQDSAYFMQLINTSLELQEPGAEIYSVNHYELIFDKEDIVFCFNAFEAAAFAYGGFQVRIPKKAINNLLAPEFKIEGENNNL